MENMQERKKAPFSFYEKEFLKELVAGVADVIESKKTDSDFNKKKNQTWDIISEKFNSNPQCQKVTTKQLKKLWLNLKARARDAKTIEKQRSHTGGGPYIPDMSPDNDFVLSLVPHIMPTIKVNQDSDGKSDVDADDDNMSWMPKRARIDHSKTNEFTDHNYSLDSTSNTTIVYPQTPATTVDSFTHNSAPIQSKVIKSTKLPNAVHTITSAPNNTDTTTTPLHENNPSTVLTPNRETEKTNKRRQKTFIPSIDSLKIKLIENDIKQRQIKFEKQQAHQDKINDLEYKILLLEYEHKKQMLGLELKQVNNNNNFSK